MKKRSSKFRYVAIIILLLFLIVGLYGDYMDFYIDAGFDVSDAHTNSILYTALSSAVNFAIVSVIPLIIKIRNRESYYKHSVIIYVLSDIVIFGMYLLLFNYIKDYYHFGLLGLFLYSIVAYALFVDPYEKYCYLNNIDIKKNTTKAISRKKINKDASNNNYSDKYDSLIKLKDLYDKKIITKEEFDKEKEKILKWLEVYF